MLLRGFRDNEKTIKIKLRLLSIDHTILRKPDKKRYNISKDKSRHWRFNKLVIGDFLVFLLKKVSRLVQVNCVK